jgi:XTP/dITP diphosphohydrolase
MKFWVATSNKGKLNEFKVLLKSTFPEAEILSISDVSVFYPPPENGKTYVENARIKTKSLKAVKPEDWVIGDDTGIEVKGLDNLPGIHSARYAGPKASDSENRVKMLKMLQLRNVSDRSASFKCCIIAYPPSGEEWVFESEMKGTINKKEIGDLGFGYDSIFIPDGQTKTLAELGPAFKNQYSHRAQGIKQFIQKAISITAKSE